MKTTKRLLSILLSVAVFVAALCVTVPASAGGVSVSIREGDYMIGILNTTPRTYTIAEYIGSQANITLPDTYNYGPIVGIDENAFTGTPVGSVVIPEGYKYIEARAFAGAGSLVSVVCNSTALTQVDDNAFSNCYSLRTVDFSKATGLTAIPAETFKNDRNLTNVSLPSSIVSIGSQAFSNTGLTSITIPDSVSQIGNSAFAGCYRLTNVTLSKNLHSISSHMFNSCRSLRKLEIPENVQVIENGAFSGCVALSEIELPDSIRYIGNDAFENCSQLRELFISQKVTGIGENALPKNVTVYCFKNSAAHNYCEKNSINYVLLDTILGDVNFDNNVNISDATMIQRYALNKLVFPKSLSKVVADVNRDGKIDIRDVTCIQLYCVRRITDFSQVR